ncbi:MAG: hypothetical protein Q7T26_02010 [Dehalococcoidia bacterium]|nr:hypothetical protein [Dehalococcoidia bacterium]
MDKQPRQNVSEPVYEVVWPLGKAASEAIALRPPVSDLGGKTVGEMWDWLFKGDEMFAHIRRRIQERYRGTRFVDYKTFGNIHGRTEREVIAALPGLLREQGCEVVISGVGA